jgi:hypothetical protein
MKCTKYWPSKDDNEAFQLGSLKITPTGETTDDSLTTRTFTVTDDKVYYK